MERPHRQMEFRHFAYLSHLQLQQHRAEGKSVSKTHDENHLKHVGLGIEPVGRLLGLSSREIELGEFAGLFHDGVRSPREDVGVSDEAASAKKAVTLLESANERGIFTTSQEERDAIAYAILHHGKTPAAWKDPATRNNPPETLNDKLHMSLYVSDGLQKLGIPLIIRRSAFVGGERRVKGDLEDFIVTPVQAVLLESAVRLGWKNTEDVYPDAIKSIIQPEFALQREWVCGLLASEGMNLEAWADMLYYFKARRRSIFDVAGIPSPKTKPEIKQQLEKVGKITDKDIRKAKRNQDLQLSSQEVVMHFSEHYEQEQDQAVAEWTPKGELAKQWKQQIVALES